jgi:hypothetical protein
MDIGLLCFFGFFKNLSWIAFKNDIKSTFQLLPIPLSNKLMHINFFSIFQPFWSGPLTEVVSLLYKDQHVATLQKLLSQWLESDGTDSTSDDESNTSPVVRDSQLLSSCF